MTTMRRLPLLSNACPYSLGMLRRSAGFLALVCMAAMFFRAGLARAEGRVALVVGNSAYEHAPVLPNPSKDADLLARTLRSIGFDVMLLNDVTRLQLTAALRDFGDKADGADVALLFYAGHGIQVSRGNGSENYIIPVDARLLDVRDIDDEALGLGRILTRLEGARSRIIILDACRDNPLGTKMRGQSDTRGVTRGLARVDATSRGTLLVFSTEPGAVALDSGGTGVNSPFALSLARFLPTPALDVRQMLTRVRADVNRETKGKQTPWSNDGLFDDLFMAPEVHTGMARPPASLPADAVTLDRELWAAVNDSTDPADFEVYLQRFPNGLFAAVAHNRLKRLRPPSPVTAVLAPTPSPESKPVSAPIPGLPAILPSRPHLASRSQTAAIVPPRSVASQPSVLVQPTAGPVPGSVACLLPSGATQPMGRSQCRQALGMVLR